MLDTAGGPVIYYRVEHHRGHPRARQPLPDERDARDFLLETEDGHSWLVEARGMRSLLRPRTVEEVGTFAVPQSNRFTYAIKDGDALVVAGTVSEPPASDGEGPYREAPPPQIRDAMVTDGGLESVRAYFVITRVVLVAMAAALLYGGHTTLSPRALASAPAWAPAQGSCCRR
jgi:hypothetical protein